MVDAIVVDSTAVDSTVVDDQTAVDDQTITLALVSHTNVGKTTLARTLLRRDVGQVLDQAHVTEVSTPYSLITRGTSELILSDTPGFGDSARLLKRLRQHERPLVWFFQQLWDRATDRPLWCGQQAALTVRHDADVVLYLVNAAEEPEEAGYVAPELELLSWIGRPILLLLNQTGGSAGSTERLAQRIDRWRRHAERWPLVRGVLSLDAFSRCWVEERVLLDAVEEVLPEDRQPVMAGLSEAWMERHMQVFERSMGAMARHLASTAIDRIPLPETGASSGLSGKGKAARKKAMEELAERLEASVGELTRTLLELHGLEGGVVEDFEQELDAFQIRGELIEPDRGALLGSAVSGAMGGLAADLMAGGLTFGGGVLAGAILGALGGAGLARGYQLLKGEKPSVGWTPDFLDAYTHQVLLRYLMVAHFGRGRGELRHWLKPERWHADLTSALRQRQDERLQVWRRAPKADRVDSVAEDLAPLLRSAVARVLVDQYPHAHWLLAGDPPRRDTDPESWADG